MRVTLCWIGCAVVCSCFCATLKGVRSVLIIISNPMLASVTPVAWCRITLRLRKRVNVRYLFTFAHHKTHQSNKSHISTLLIELIFSNNQYFYSWRSKLTYPWMHWHRRFLSCPIPADSLPRNRPRTPCLPSIVVDQSHPQLGPAWVAVGEVTLPLTNRLRYSVTSIVSDSNHLGTPKPNRAVRTDLWVTQQVRSVHCKNW